MSTPYPPHVLRWIKDSSISSDSHLFLTNAHFHSLMLTLDSKLMLHIEFFVHLKFVFNQNVLPNYFASVHSLDTLLTYWPNVPISIWYLQFDTSCSRMSKSGVWCCAVILTNCWCQFEVWVPTALGHRNTWHHPLM